MTTLMTTTRTALGGALALALAPAFWPSEAAAHTCDDPFRTDLLTGRSIDAGDVTVRNDDTTLTVTYEATCPWCLLKTDLHVASEQERHPPDSSGTLRWGKFEFSEERAPGGDFGAPRHSVGRDRRRGGARRDRHDRRPRRGRRRSPTDPPAMCRRQVRAWAKARFPPTAPRDVLHL